MSEIEMIQKLSSANPGWTINADVIVIGSGIAGLTAALTAREKNLSVLLLTKDVLSSTIYEISSGPWNGQNRGKKSMVDYLQSVTLKDLVLAQESRGVAVLTPFINKNKPHQSSPERSNDLNVVDAKKVKREPTPKRFIVNSVFNLAQQN